MVSMFYYYLMFLNYYWYTDAYMLFNLLTCTLSTADP